MRLLLLVGLLVLGVGVWAETASQPVPPIIPVGIYTDANLVGVADLIVVGTVSRVQVSATWPQWFEGTATLKRPKVLKGAATGDIAFVYPTARVSGGITLKRGTKGVFFLRWDGAGYRLIGGANGVKAIGMARAYADMVAAFPLAVAITSITPNLGNPTAGSVTISVTNTGKYPVTAALDNYTALITLPKGPQVITAARTVDIHGTAYLRDVTPAQPFTLQPGQSQSFTYFGIPFAAPRALVDDLQPNTRAVAVQVLLNARLQPPFAPTPSDPKAVLEFFAASPWKTFQATVPVR
jgi:hypothetical protein